MAEHVRAEDFSERWGFIVLGLCGAIDGGGVLVGPETLRLGEEADGGFFERRPCDGVFPVR